MARGLAHYAHAITSLAAKLPPAGWCESCSHQDMASNTPGTPPSEADPTEKCAHPSCACLLAPDRPFGKYCGEHCEDAGEMSELRCECGHEMCSGSDTPAAR
jgi:hypothetical protein